MPKTKEKQEGHLVYLAEHIGEDDCWEWWDLYDSQKWTVFDVFESFISDFLGEAPPMFHEELVREGAIWTYPKLKNFRVWEVTI